MNLMYLLRRARDQFGARPAILEAGGAVSYSEFYQRVERSAAYLVGAGVAPGARLAIILSNSPEYLELLYSTAMAGIAVVPLNNRWNLDDFVFAIEDSGTVALAVDDRYLEMGQQIQARVPRLSLFYAGTGECPPGALPYRAGVDAAQPLHSHPEAAPDDLLGIFYTSGTTGGPKGAMLSHRNVCANAVHAHATGLQLGERYLHSAPMFHLADGAGTHVATLTGAAHSFLPVFDPGAYLQAVEQLRIHSSILVPTMINLLLRHPRIDTADLSSLRYMVYGASHMPLPLLQLAMQKIPCQYVEGYGMTETSPLQTILLPEDHRLENLDCELTPIRSAGRPMVGCEVRVVDAMDRPLPAGEPGEVVARGDNVMLGYWNRPEINQVVLRGGWMHTGDIGVFDRDGFLYILDRVKDMIKTGGENVFTPEVEAMLVSHPEVVEATVIGVADERWGESIRALVVRRPDSGLCEQDLIAYCRDRMTHFKCPSSVVFLDALPKTGSGKVQKNTLRKAYGS